MYVQFIWNLHAQIPCGPGLLLIVIMTYWLLPPVWGMCNVCDKTDLFWHFPSCVNTRARFVLRYLFLLTLKSFTRHHIEQCVSDTLSLKAPNKTNLFSVLLNTAANLRTPGLREPSERAGSQRHCVDKSLAHWVQWRQLHYCSL